MKLMDHLDKLNSFKVIAEGRTMREAALKLHVSQPSLTKLVNTLEEASGVKLLIRGRQGVATTEAGKLFLAYGHKVLRDLEDVEQRIIAPYDHMSGHLKVAAYASLAEYLWPNFIPVFLKAAPSLRLSILTGENIGHRYALERDDVDILVDAEPRLSGDFISWELYSDRFNFFMKGKLGHPLTPETISGIPLIYSPLAFDSENKRIIQHLEEAGYFFRERVELDSFTAVMAFAKKGLGLAVLPMRLAEEGVNSGHLNPVTLKNFPSKGFGAHSFSATIKENRKDDPRLRFLVKSLRSWFK